MKRLVFFPMLLLGLAFAAVAQTSAPSPAEPATPQANESAATDAAKPASTDGVASKDEASDRNCLKETGSRLAPRADSKGRKCINATGRSYTKGDLDSTGAVDLNDALRRLDPAVH